MKKPISISILLILLTNTHINATEFKITSISKGATETVITYTKDTNAYFITVSGHTPGNMTHTSAVTMGQGSVAIDDKTNGNVRFYSIIRVQKDEPLDSDGDGINDLVELQAYSDPLTVDTDCASLSVTLSITMEGKRSFFKTFSDDINNTDKYSNQDVINIICAGINIGDSEINAHIIDASSVNAISAVYGEEHRDLSHVFQLRNMLKDTVQQGIQSKQIDMDWWKALAPLAMDNGSDPDIQSLMTSLYQTFPEEKGGGMNYNDIHGSQLERHGYSFDPNIDFNYEPELGSVSCNQLKDMLNEYGKEAGSWYLKRFKVPMLTREYCTLWQAMNEDWIIPAHVETYKTSYTDSPYIIGTEDTIAVRYWKYPGNTEEYDPLAYIVAPTVYFYYAGLCKRNLSNITIPKKIKGITIPKFMRNAANSIIEDHHDVTLIQRWILPNASFKEVTVSKKGFFALNNVDAIEEALASMLRRFWPKKYWNESNDGWVSGYVGDSDAYDCNTKRVSKETFMLIQNRIDNARENKYHLLKYQCQHWAKEKLGL